MLIWFSLLCISAKLDDQNDSIMWENMLPDLQPPIPMSLPMNYLASLGEHQFVFTEPQLMFPKLTSLQRDFGVNPGYQMYNEPKISSHKQLDWHLGKLMSSHLFSYSRRWPLPMSRVVSARAVKESDFSDLADLDNVK